MRRRYRSHRPRRQESRRRSDSRQPVAPPPPPAPRLPTPHSLKVAKLRSRYDRRQGVARRLTSERRDEIAAEAAARYGAGEGWREIGNRYGLSGEYVRRFTIARHDITYRRWGRRPAADPQEVSRRRDEGQTLTEIAAALGCSRQAVRTALETAAGRTSTTRYPRLSERRAPMPAELERISALYEACPPAPRSRPGAHDMRGPDGRAVAQACHDLVADGVPMQTLSKALGRAATWVHWLVGIHDLRPATRPTQSTARRTREL